MARFATVLVTAVAGAAFSGCESVEDPAPRGYMLAGRGPLTVTATSEGQIKALKEFTIDCPTHGRVEWLHPNGEPAKKGDVVVRLDSRDQFRRSLDLRRDLETVKREVEELGANVEIQKQRTALDLERKDAEVKVSRLNLREIEALPTAEDLAEAEADYKSAQAQAEAAATDYTETRSLLQKGFATEAETDSKRIDALLATARRDLAKLRLEQVKRGADRFKLEKARIAVRKAEINEALARQNAAAKETNLDKSLQWAKERVRRAKDRLDDNLKDIERRKVKAPRDGIVVHVTTHWGGKIEEGSRAWRGMGLVNLPDLGIMKVRSHVSEQDVRHLKLGDIVDVTVHPIPDKTYRAKVFWIDNWARDKNAMLSEADRKKQGLSGLMVFDFEAELLESDPRLKLGFQAKVEVPLYRIEDAVTVDPKAIHRDHGAPYVMVLEKQPVKRPVELGASSGGKVVVIKGLSGGEKLLPR